VAQAREVIDLSIASQQGLVEKVRQQGKAGKASAGRRRRRRMMDWTTARREGEHVAPVWAVFGDLMSGLVGAFVLVLVGVLVVQMDLVASLQAEVQKRQVEEQAPHGAGEGAGHPAGHGPRHAPQRPHRHQRQRAVPGQLRPAAPEGRQLLQEPGAPLRVYLGERNEMLMVSGFTDDKPISEGNRRFADNLELSAQRALTVTRALIDEGMPSSQVFAAAFGAEQPVASNADDERPRPEPAGGDGADAVAGQGARQRRPAQLAPPGAPRAALDARPVARVPQPVHVLRRRPVVDRPGRWQHGVGPRAARRHPEEIRSRQVGLNRPARPRKRLLANYIAHNSIARYTSAHAFHTRQRR
jgi:hypothetical protein